MPTFMGPLKARRLKDKEEAAGLVVEAGTRSFQRSMTMSRNGH